MHVQDPSTLGGNTPVLRLWFVLQALCVHNTGPDGTPLPLLLEAIVAQSLDSILSTVAVVRLCVNYVCEYVLLLRDATCSDALLMRVRTLNCSCRAFGEKPCVCD